jgi:hypothetical protein
MHRALIAALAVAAVTGPWPALAADKPLSRDLDLVWAHPALDTVSLGRIAMLPAASFDRDLSNEKLVEGMLAAALRGSGHRWLSTTSTRTLLRTATGNDSLLNGVCDALLKNARLDSLAAIRVCEQLRAGALLGIRVDRFEQVKLDAAQTGKPSTTVQVKAALMDARGRLLWTISGSEVGEGPYQSPGSNPYRTPAGGVNLNPTNPNAGPPSYEEVVQKLFDRWAERFPRAREPAE